MLARKITSIRLLLLTVTTSISIVLSSVAIAQDNSTGRYRPDGRQIARDVAQMFDERMYEVRTYDPVTDVAQFSAASIFYPLTLSFSPPIGAVAFVPGFRANSEIYEWWGPMLASVGYVVMIIDTNQPTDALAARKEALIAAVEFLRNENSRDESPVKGRIDVNKIAIMGHSMGGGAALQAADELGDALKAVIPLSPYCCEPGQSFSGDLAGQDVPTLIFASAEDTIAPPDQHARALFESIGDTTAKAYLEFATGDHNLSTNGGPDLVTLGRYSMAWLKLQLDGEQRYSDAIFSEQSEEYATKFSRYETSQ